jgi:hypothetical protein
MTSHVHYNTSRIYDKSPSHLNHIVILAGASQVKKLINPHNAFCIEQRATAKSKEAQVRVFGLFLPLPRLSPVGLIAR